jgi:hypothetical protein
VKKFALIRNLLMVLGALVGGAFFFAVLASPPKETGRAAPDAPRALPVPVEAPVEAPPVVLERPLSLDASFGRSHLVGAELGPAPRNPLDSLDFERRWDANIALPPPELAPDLPAGRAHDEVSTPDEAPTPAITRERLPRNQLPVEAQRLAQDAQVLFREAVELYETGWKLQQQGGDEERRGREMLAEARSKLETARDLAVRALTFAPDDRNLQALSHGIRQRLASIQRDRRTAGAPE